MNISLSFGGNSWPISSADMNLGPPSGGAPTSGGQCLGGIFDIGQASSTGEIPNWIVGDTFLVRDYNPLFGILC